ncbi:hypothetical protein AMATHDRAFT_142301 [Amanita thiersii Skay4041]|uniref:RING-type domain-containing protein n=1 Tax=Amanita thiersii Skay4041 TaxID=703135 RepID=A0A2A9NLS7_9AGAR|nr:hypothetical protein AMATHDRAFT_142301 [Amanita thiersii Skay4041]
MIYLYVALILLTGFAFIAQAYVPAQPTNSSRVAIDGGLNVTDISKLQLQWYLNGFVSSYVENVSYQLVGLEGRGISKGALVHFSEAFVKPDTPTTNTPWIAMVSCDANATNASMEVDVFTLARDKGAKAAASKRSHLLYSLYSLACVINPEYADPETFDQVFDIFSTQSLTSAHLIEYQFGQSGEANTTLYKSYDSRRLNDSEAVINATIELGYPVAPGYLYAVLRAYNATDDPSGTAGGSSEGNGVGSSNNSKSPNTSLAMIILYAITGCVSALFCVVIISGAVRAIRHPERYGPRARFGGDGSPQSRARGLTRAILDTFPVVKFGGPTQDPDTNKDVEAVPPNSSHVELKRRKASDAVLFPTAAQDLSPTTELEQRKENRSAIESTPRQGDTGSSTFPSASMPIDGPVPRSEKQCVSESSHLGSRSPRPATDSRQQNDLMPESIGTETCPICIIDFEEGDDIRILPCEGKHKFHQSCVDQWLLELSSSCPICRHDFHVLETMMTRDSDDEDVDPRESQRMSRIPSNRITPTVNRLSRYLRFASRRRDRRRREREDDSDPTDPYLPPPPESLTHGV